MTMVPMGDQIVGSGRHVSSTYVEVGEAVQTGDGLVVSKEGV